MTDRKPDKPQKPISDRHRRPTLDEVWQVHSAGDWPQDLSLDRPTSTKAGRRDAHRRQRAGQRPNSGGASDFRRYEERAELVVS